MSIEQPQGDAVEQAARIVVAYVSHNAIAAGSIPDLLASVHRSLRQMSEPAGPETKPLVPPAPIKKTVTQDHIISLEDGKPYKSLKRHLAAYGLTPAEYRRKWGLPVDYPMVAPSYSETRSRLAKELGLGRKSEIQH